MMFRVRCASTKVAVASDVQIRSAILVLHALLSMTDAAFLHEHSLIMALGRSLRKNLYDRTTMCTS